MKIKLGVGLAGALVLVGALVDGGAGELTGVSLASVSVSVSASAPAPRTPVPSGPGKVRCPKPTAVVGSVSQLRKALASARPGAVIQLRPGVYQGEFAAQKSGTRAKPIFLCGTAASVLDGGGIKKGYGFHLDNVSYWRLVGFTVRNSQKGVMADRTRNSIIQGLSVHEIGDEAIHLRVFSTGNIVQYSKIYNTGLRRAQFGEGVYLGSAESNWGRYTGGKMDRSDRNLVRGNVIRARAEAVDIKEGTRGGRIVGNIFDGSVLGGHKFNDSWIDVKGNDYVIENNSGRRTPQDGFQTHEIVDGWGTGNVFRGNRIDLAGGRGVGINDTVGGNTITCDNKVTGGPLLKKGACS
ncbi:hypothetical protein Aph01nite_07070 [Acrocarpospora phusangensis]|uniref:Right handed beta helix domain-containing protein n=1 Tax=Acrocarpospora phusangensis TaxID=1070424 RepID=A0A919ULN4_9ACTN|nr:right-handed parallel beta-helix repeat-containing protein [Acrocarpospora phusangensis]GIH22397.1 hypothetical protein Aph01nite_07070 [Acrocarpospora phusangensis]